MRRPFLLLIPVAAAALAAAPFLPSPLRPAERAEVAQATPRTEPEFPAPPAPGAALPDAAAPSASAPSASPNALRRVYADAVDGAARVNIGSSGLGSGFFLTADGLFLTAAHVALAEPGADLSVTTNDGRTLPAEVVGYDEARDVALLRVRGSNFRSLPLAVAAPGVGDGIVAIGNSRGDFDAGRAGRVTALDVSLDASFPSGLVASSMPLAPGDSGGPVLNARGEVVGVSTAIGQENGRFSSYFVPLTRASGVVTDLRAGARRGVPVLGVGVADARAALGTAGALVTEVTPGLGAEAAGLRPAEVRALRDDTGRETREVVSADVIVGVDGRAVEAPADLVAYLRTKTAGDRVTLRVRRDGKDVTLTVELRAKAA